METNARKYFDKAFGQKSPQRMDLETSSNRKVGICNLIMFSPSLLENGRMYKILSKVTKSTYFLSCLATKKKRAVKVITRLLRKK